MTKIQCAAKIKTLLLLLLLLAAAIGGPTAAYGDDQCTLTVNFSVENHTKGIAGGVFGLVKVLDHQNGRLSWNAQIRHKGIGLDAVAKGTGEAAKGLAVQNQSYMTEKTTDANGNIVFDPLSEGIWLIAQTDADGEAADYESAAPFLVAVMHSPKGEADKGVTVYPKTVKRLQDIEKTEQDRLTGGPAEQALAKISPVKTDDEALVERYLFLLLASGLLIWMTKKKTDGVSVRKGE